MKRWPVLLSLVCATVSGQQQTAVHRLETGAIHLKGWLGDKIDLCVQNGISSRSGEKNTANSSNTSSLSGRRTRAQA